MIDIFIIILLLIIIYYCLYICKIETLVNKNNLSGYEPHYEPNKWNIKPYMLSHNCYEYALNDYENNDANKCKNRIQYCNKNVCNDNNGNILKTSRQICNNLNLKSNPYAFPLIALRKTNKSNKSN